MAVLEQDKAYTGKVTGYRDGTIFIKTDIGEDVISHENMLSLEDTKILHRGTLVECSAVPPRKLIPGKKTLWYANKVKVLPEKIEKPEEKNEPKLHDKVGIYSFIYAELRSELLGPALYQDKVYAGFHINSTKTHLFLKGAGNEINDKELCLEDLADLIDPFVEEKVFRIPKRFIVDIAEIDEKAYKKITRKFLPSFNLAKIPYTNLGCDQGSKRTSFF